MAVFPATLPGGTGVLVSEVELVDFHTKHFSGPSKDYFAANFVSEAVGEEEDDNLGYYEDGVKRTLTDEQIAMFRHTEIETLLSEKRRSEEAKINTALDSKRKIIEDLEIQDTVLPGTHISETRQISSEVGQPFHTTSGTEDQKKKKSHFKRNIKPDLRKRTWDQVDTGLETLDYEENVAQPSHKRNAGPQRRTISYDDM